MELLREQMGSSLFILTFHGMGFETPEDLSDGGLSWRVGTYYDLAMGGAVVNGKDAGSINTVGKSQFDASPITMSADLLISSKVVDSDKNSADISVTVTAKNALPLKTVLHIIVIQTRIVWKDAYGFDPPNGQTYMYNVVRDLVTDSVGAPIPALNPGEKDSLTTRFTCNPTLQIPDSLRVVALLQGENTKEILSIAQSIKSPLDTTSSPIVVMGKTDEKAKLQVITTGNRQITVILPFGKSIATVFDATGRVLVTERFDDGKIGQKKIVTLPSARQVMILKLESGTQSSRVVVVPFIK